MMKNLFQKYLTSSFFLNAPLVINTLIALATLPVVLVNLPIAEYGKWQFFLAVQMWLVASTAGNITVASKRGIAKGMDGTFIYAFLARLKLLFSAGFLVLGVAFAFKILRGNNISVLLAIIGLYLIFGYLFQISFFEFLIAKKRFREWCFWQILIFSVSIVGSTLAAFLTKNIIYFALVQLGSVGLLGFIAWLWIVTKDNLVKSYKKVEIDKECVHYGLKLIPVDLVLITASKVSHFLIGTFFGFANLALFSVANKLRDKFAGIIKSVRPLLYADFAKIEGRQLIRVINRHLLKIGAFGIFLTFLFIGVGWFYMKFFLPESFQKASVYFAILALGLPAGILAIVLHTILESHLRYKELTVIGIIPNLLKIILILAFGCLWRITGVCFALTISGWLSFGFYYLLTLKKHLVLDTFIQYPLQKKISKF